MSNGIAISDLMTTQQQIEALALTELEQRRLLAKIAGLVIERSKQRVKSQTDLDGRVFEPRKPTNGKKSRKRLLRYFEQRVAVINLSGSKAEVGFKSGMTERLAAKNQYGSTETVRASQLPRQNSDGGATRTQAIALIAANYKIKLRGGARKTPTINWITQNMTIGQAGAILSDMRGVQAQLWNVTIAARSFLGMTDKDMHDITQIALNEIQQGA